MRSKDISQKAKPPLHPLQKSWAALSEVRKGVATVMDILEATNFKKGTVAYAKKKFDLRAAIRDVVSQLEPTASEKGLSIELSIGEGEFLFEGDEDKLKRHVIRNLIDNAIKYTPRGVVKVVLTDGSVIRFIVEDNGRQTCTPPATASTSRRKSSKPMAGVSGRSPMATARARCSSWSFRLREGNFPSRHTDNR
ncbi:MAG: Hybrid sensor histidine kinase [Candidatus Kaiserbacteria bacterium GW2011_GWC2_49_12]|uniref:histidine kinase n=1 Tax=Candidatus Kaiserbacteria bacterium GW2011_GWC2_49_12 TaxID=1618675 RepID=A0A0G1VFM1_9BACT|nr:MAG: Hybrid sensor histidine kinase [Candidatus Kaiserbacteria bacterium GW2011_GWC2_49_12]